MKNCKTSPRPTALSLEILQGRVEYCEKALSYRNDPVQPHEVGVWLVHEGAGMVGLSALTDNQSWAGIWNHILLTTRLATNIASKLCAAGTYVDMQLMLEALIDSHTMRRKHDEAVWYPLHAPNSVNSRKLPHEHLGVLYLQEKGIRREVVSIVDALGRITNTDENLYNSWEYRIAIYADHRCGQTIEPLYVRMANFFIRNIFGSLDNRHRIFIEEKFKALIELTKEDPITGKDAAEWLKSSLTEPSLFISDMGRIEDLSAFLQLVIDDAKTEQDLQRSKLRPYEWTDQTISMPRWEWYLRTLYVSDVDYDELATSLLASGYTFADGKVNRTAVESHKDNSKVSHWERSAQDVVNINPKRKGIDRAIKFFEKLDNDLGNE